MMKCLKYIFIKFFSFLFISSFIFSLSVSKREVLESVSVSVAASYPFYFLGSPYLLFLASDPAAANTTQRRPRPRPRASATVPRPLRPSAIRHPRPSTTAPPARATTPPVESLPNAP